MQAVIPIIFFVWGIIQLFAILGTVREIIPIPLVDFLISFFIAEIPVIGSIAGIHGAMSNWGWDFIPAVLLFFGHFLLIIPMSLFSKREV